MCVILFNFIYYIMFYYSNEYYFYFGFCGCFVVCKNLVLDCLFFINKKCKRRVVNNKE